MSNYDYKAYYQTALQESQAKGELALRFYAITYVLGTDKDITNAERGKQLQALCEVYDGITAKSRQVL